MNEEIKLNDEAIDKIANVVISKLVDNRSDGNLKDMINKKFSEDIDLTMIGVVEEELPKIINNVSLLIEDRIMNSNNLRDLITRYVYEDILYGSHGGRLNSIIPARSELVSVTSQLYNLNSKVDELIALFEIYKDKVDTSNK